MNDPNRHILERAVELLSPLLDELVFVGGCATGLLVTDPTAAGIRPTRDVDTITQVSSYAEYAELSAQLRRIGLQEDTTGGAICRWLYEQLIIDVMPDDERILGFTNRWYKSAIATATKVRLQPGTIRLVTSPYFLATKQRPSTGVVRQIWPTARTWKTSSLSSTAARRSSTTSDTLSPRSRCISPASSGLCSPIHHSWMRSLAFFCLILRARRALN